ncbi:MAG: hypothetical protein QOJ50_71, partial [Cryptosporangiaceae bacterium]|nr:hypothetical protein [Cryptosporangiaceae bacterium]
MTASEPGGAVELHRRALAETEAGRHRAAERLLRAALTRHPDAATTARVLITLAYHEAVRHGLARGLATLSHADSLPGLPARARGLIASQRALLHTRAGQFGEALAQYDAAAGLLGGAVPEDLCRILLNRGLVQMQRRDLADARADLTRCQAIASAGGLAVLAAKALHNLGYLDLLAGNLPSALRRMDAAAPALSTSPVSAAVIQTDRARVLLAAGLLTEADEGLGHAVRTFGAARERQLQAEAELTRAHVALVEERYADARRIARQAGRRFTARGSTGWAMLAELAEADAAAGQGRPPPGAGDAAVRLAAGLAERGMTEEARAAVLVAAADRIARGDPDGARVLAGPAVGPRARDPLALRLRSHAVSAALASARGDTPGCERALRAAMRDLRRHQATLGALEMQAAVTRHGERLARLGLARAVRTGRPTEVFRWSEWSRSLSSCLPAAVPSADPQAAALTEELRHTRALLRDQSLAGTADPALGARCRWLERAIRERSWRREGPGTITAPATLATLRRALHPDSAVFVAHLLTGGELHALAVTETRHAIVPLGPLAPVLARARRWRADLDMLGGTALGGPLLAVVRASAASTADALDAALLRALPGWCGGGPLLLAPAPALATLAWTLLPSVRGRPVAAVRSGTEWLGRRAATALPPRPRVAAVAGPRVPRGADEAALVVAGWPG